MSGTLVAGQFSTPHYTPPHKSGDRSDSGGWGAMRKGVSYHTLVRLIASNWRPR